ncbi:phosphate uptake regulator PhoU [Paucilactobacillus suebicus DSM 5007 = KCTC 3549]|uniref:Phosphate-specific transport system accessory protein PhoU n=2 Tax=Paucilactobacillus suebicus TaxID=152335 RepID=A0A0R1VYY4_9LACO|nr:phosphate uptake regulator PhoU [Paucilactobacillus suebicus DSM 5007 = KCTC 3549]
MDQIAEEVNVMNELFSDELKKLKWHFMEMGINVSEQIYQSTKAFIDHDRQLAQSVIDNDQKTNDEETNLEMQALNLIALKQPVAEDFRSIISILKASSDLERVGDHAVNIARETIRVSGSQRVPAIEGSIADMTASVRSMLEKVLDAYVHSDEDIARQVAKSDLEVDKQYILIRDNITAAMRQNADTVTASSSYLMVSRLLERVGDHIVNLAEWIVYNSTGELTELNPGKSDPEMLHTLLNNEESDKWQ